MTKNQSTTSKQVLKFTLKPKDASHLVRMCGQFNKNIDHIEKLLNLNIHFHGDEFSILGDKTKLQNAKNIIKKLFKEATTNDLTEKSIHLVVTEFTPKDKEFRSNITIKTLKKTIIPRKVSQKHYIESIINNDITFGIGPAGTGKTYLAVAVAAQALLEDEVNRILLVRPAVEAGEKLGFLPGDLTQKVDPYLRPLYDALYEMFGIERIDKLIEKNIIEVAPLAYMRGRTLDHSFIILDEAQNTTKEQMKMFLTRIGFGTTAVICGDNTQIDLPKISSSGLLEAIRVLRDIKEIGFCWFDSEDVVRHPIVKQIVSAYDNYDNNISTSSG